MENNEKSCALLMVEQILLDEMITVETCSKEFERMIEAMNLIKELQRKYFKNSLLTSRQFSDILKA